MKESEIYNLIKKLNKVRLNNPITQRMLYKQLSQDVNITKLTKQQKQEIQEYWMNLLHRKVSTQWHELLSSINGFFTPRYMPYEVYSELISKANIPNRIMSFIDDKNLNRYFLKDFKIPVREVECVNGVYYLPKISTKEVSREQAFEYCKEINDCVIKPSKCSSTGNGVHLFDYQSFIGDVCGRDFVIEKRIRCNANLANLNYSSCNTIRLHTFRNRDEGVIEFISAYIRIGRKDKIVDNAGQGGIICKIVDGCLQSDACVLLPNYHLITQSDTGVTLRGYKIDKWDEIVETAIAAHSCLPFMDLIGWDITVDEHDCVVIIEYNPNPDLRQEQLLFRDTVLLDKQEEIIRALFEVDN